MLFFLYFANDGVLLIPGIITGCIYRRNKSSGKNTNTTGAQKLCTGA
jgi:hypothetical protein